MLNPPLSRFTEQQSCLVREPCSPAVLSLDARLMPAVRPGGKEEGEPMIDGYLSSIAHFGCFI